MKRLAIFIATGAFSGYSPIASGTVASLWGIFLVLLLIMLPSAWYLPLVLIILIISVWASDKSEPEFNQKDPHEIVIDEIACYPIAAAFMPLGAPYFLELNRWALFTWLACAFLLFRFFDIYKPPPAHKLQELPGGWGIVIDDVFAGIYALIVMQIFGRLILYFTVA